MSCVCRMVSFKKSFHSRLFVISISRFHNTGYLIQQRGGHAERPAQPKILQIEEVAQVVISHSDMWKT